MHPNPATIACLERNGLIAAPDETIPHVSHKRPPATAPPAFIPPFPPLGLVTKPNLTTAELAYYLNRRPQTLRIWASKSGSGPMVPKRIGGILAWSTTEAKVLVGVAAC
jgi:hypothetical protein